MFEVITTDDFTFAVNTPKATFNVVKSGVYRVDVLEDGTGKIEVWKGKAQIGEDEDAMLKKEEPQQSAGDDVAVAKFDRDEKDSILNNGAKIALKNWQKLMTVLKDKI